MLNCVEQLTLCVKQFFRVQIRKTFTRLNFFARTAAVMVVTNIKYGFTTYYANIPFANATFAVVVETSHQILRCHQRNNYLGRLIGH